MDYIYGTISQKAEKMNYKGSTSDSAKVDVNGTTISATVLRDVPNWNSEDTNKVLTVNTDGTLCWKNAATGTFNFNELQNRPTYAGFPMTNSTDIPEVRAAYWNSAALALGGHTVGRNVPSDAVFTDTTPKYNGVKVTDETNIPEVKTSTWDAKSVVTASSTGDSEQRVNYIKIDGTEYKLGVKDFNISSISLNTTTNILTIDGLNYQLTPVATP